jgi:hypothetical protein
VGSLNERLRRRLAGVEGLIESESMFAPNPAYWVNGKEVAHFEADGVIEIRLTRARIKARRPALKSDPRVHLRPSGADWITVRVSDAGDLDFVAELVDLARDAHLPPAGVTAKPPPTGAALARRRRFH